MSSSARELMEERARELARPREEPVAAGVVLLPFHAGGAIWAVEVSRVHQVLEAERIHPLFGVRQPVIGAVLARTRPVPVLDVRRVLGLPAASLSDLQRVVVLMDDGDLFGLAVERVGRRMELAPAQLTPVDTGLLRFTGPDRLGVLDVARLGLGAHGGV